MRLLTIFSKSLFAGREINVSVMNGGEGVLICLKNMKNYSRFPRGRDEDFSLHCIMSRRNEMDSSGMFFNMMAGIPSGPGDVFPQRDKAVCKSFIVNGNPSKVPAYAVQQGVLRGSCGERSVMVLATAISSATVFSSIYAKDRKGSRGVFSLCLGATLPHLGHRCL